MCIGWVGICGNYSTAYICYPQIPTFIPVFLVANGLEYFTCHMLILDQLRDLLSSIRQASDTFFVVNRKAIGHSLFQIREVNTSQFLTGMGTQSVI